MNYKIVEKGPFQVVGVKQTFSSSNGEHMTGIPKMWEDIHRDGTIELLLSLNNGPLKGVLGICVSSSDAKLGQTMNYWIVVEHDGDAIPDGLAKFEIPSSKWAVFEVHGSMPEAAQKAWSQIFSEWFPFQPYKPAGTPQLEVYPDGDPSSPNFYSEIWVPIQ